MTIDLALTLLISLLNNAGNISALIQKAKTEGRDLTVDELSTVASTDDLARAQFIVAIAAAKAAGK